MNFAVDIPVRFAHCDPAGIVFYPRYFEMINQTVEDWFAAMGSDFRAIHIVRGEAVPAVHIAVDFHRASRLGDRLRFELAVERLGRSTADLAITAFCDAEKRLTARLIIAYVKADPLGSLPLPEDLRARMLGYARSDDPGPG